MFDTTARTRRVRGVLASAASAARWARSAESWSVALNSVVDAGSSLAALTAVATDSTNGAS